MAIHAGAMSFGLVASFIAIGGIMTMADQSDWLPAQGHVLTVSKSCHLEARERGVFTETKYTKELPCDLVDAFKLLHADKSWHVNTVFEGQVQVERPGATNTIDMPLPSIKTREPAVGDALALRQDPADPNNVSLESSSEMGPIMLAIAIAIAVPCLWLGLGAPWPRRRRVPEVLEELAPSSSYTASSAAPVVVDTSRIRRNLDSPRRTFGRRGA